MKRELATHVFGPSGLRSLASRLFPRSGILGLNYHRIVVPGTALFDYGLWSASVEAFDHQVAWFKSRYDMIRPQELPSVLKTRKGRFALLALTMATGIIIPVPPVLTLLGDPASLFIVTGFLDELRLAW